MESKRFIGIIRFDTITTMKEFEEICVLLMKKGYELGLDLDGELVQIIISKK